MEAIFKNMIKEYTARLAEIYNFDANEAFEKVYKDKSWTSTQTVSSSNSKSTKSNPKPKSTKSKAGGARKMNAYNIYTKEKLEEFKTTKPNLPQAEKMKLIGNGWKAATLEEKQVYKDKLASQNENSSDNSSNDISSLSVKLLKDMCKEKGIKNYSKLKKDELIQKLKEDNSKTENKDTSETKINKIPKGRREASPEQDKKPIRRKIDKEKKEESIYDQETEDEIVESDNDSEENDSDNENSESDNEDSEEELEEEMSEYEEE